MAREAEAVARHGGRGRGLYGVWAVLIYVFLFSPIVLLVAFSFNANKYVLFSFTGSTTVWYSQVFSNYQLKDELSTTLNVAVKVTYISTGVRPAADRTRRLRRRAVRIHTLARRVHHHAVPHRRAQHAADLHLHAGQIRDHARGERAGVTPPRSVARPDHARLPPSDRRPESTTVVSARPRLAAPRRAVCRSRLERTAPVRRGGAFLLLAPVACAGW